MSQRPDFPFALHRVSSEFGWRTIDLGNGPFRNSHTGMDFAVGLGSPIRIGGDGRKTASGRNHATYGNWLEYHHGTHSTRYHGVTAESVSNAPDSVRRGTIIGYTSQPGASTGPHLHFEVHANGVAVNPRTLRNYRVTYEHTGRRRHSGFAPRVVVDGRWGPQTIRETQRIMNRTHAVVVDGVWGPLSVRALQKLIGRVAVDGVWGQQTIRRWQHRLGVRPDGNWGSVSVTRLQETINQRNRIFR